MGFPAGLPDGTPQIAVPFECQLWKDPEKLFRYVEYLAAARRDNRCRGHTAVFSPDGAVLRYIRRLFRAEPHLCPVLIGKDAVPKVLTLEQATKRPELSARHVEAARGQANVRILLNCLKEDQVNELKKTPEFRGTTEAWGKREPGPWLRSRAGFELGMQEGRAEGLAEGRAEGRAEGIEEGLRRGLEPAKQALKILLDARGLVASPEQLELIDRCTAAGVLAAWITKAADAKSVAEVLAV